MNKLLSPASISQNNGIALVRIIVGCLLIYHGKEIFNAVQMQEYVKWDNFKSTAFMPYLGKGAEFTAGVLLTLGLLTRLASIITMSTFIYITFFVGNGKFWYEDQHPFMFVLFGLLFFFTGPGGLSLDKMIFKKE